MTRVIVSGTVLLVIGTVGLILIFDVPRDQVLLSAILGGVVGVGICTVLQGVLK